MTDLFDELQHVRERACADDEAVQFSRPVEDERFRHAPVFYVGNVGPACDYADHEDMPDWTE